MQIRVAFSLRFFKHDLRLSQSVNKLWLPWRWSASLWSPAQATVLKFVHLPLANGESFSCRRLVNPGLLRLVWRAVGCVLTEVRLRPYRGPASTLSPSSSPKPPPPPQKKGALQKWIIQPIHFCGLAGNGNAKEEVTARSRGSLSWASRTGETLWCREGSRRRASPPWRSLARQPDHTGHGEQVPTLQISPDFKQRHILGIGHKKISSSSLMTRFQCDVNAPK